MTATTQDYHVLTMKPMMIFMIMNNITNISNRRMKLHKKYINKPILLCGHQKLSKTQKVLNHMQQNYVVSVQELQQYQNKIVGSIVFSGNVDSPNDGKLHLEYAYIDWPTKSQFHWFISERHEFNNFKTYTHKSYHTWSILNVETQKKMAKDGIFNDNFFTKQR